jgi:SAM-dependent methyltransferase
MTLSHVIEHVHDPVDTFRNCYERLNPGGELTMETPNIQSYGRDRFGAWWRGMECPRHLVILNAASIEALYKKAGFENFVYAPRAFVNLSTYPVSRNTMRGEATAVLGWFRIFADYAAVYDGFRAIVINDKAEFVKVSGRRPLS